jgi:hypothetical protein
MAEHWEPLEALRRAGLPVDQLAEEQRTVLAALSADEVELLVSLKERLDAAEPDVVAHSEWVGGVVW